MMAINIFDSFGIKNTAVGYKKIFTRPLSLGSLL